MSDDGQESDYENAEHFEHDEISTEVHNLTDRQRSETSEAGGTFFSGRLFMRPDIMPVLIDLIKYYEWPNIYYIYNYPQALLNLEVLFDAQNKNFNSTGKVLIRKIVEITDCRDMLRAIETSNEKALSTSQITMIVDLDSKESYGYFLNQVKDLGMTKTRYYYVLATFVSLCHRVICHLHDN
jgi:hypothetical protein